MKFNAREIWLQTLQFWRASHFNRLALSVVGVVVLLVVVAVFRSTGDVSKVTVTETGLVERGNLERVLTATGIIKPEEGAEVKTGTRVTGVIETLYVKLGDKVRKGQVIAVMDKREQEAECRKLQAELGSLRTELQLLEQTYPLKIQEAVADVDKARAAAKHAEVTYKRIEALSKMKSVAKAELDREQKDRATARQDEARSRTVKERLETGFELEINRLKLTIDKAEAELESAQIRLSYATIVSPLDGVVSGITAQEGETVVAGLQVADLISVLDTSRMELRIYVDENDIGEVKVGDTVRFRVEAFPDKSFSGKVALIHPGPEMRNNIVYYRALVHFSPATAQVLRPEMTAHCEIVVGNRENTLTVPNAAFKWIGPRRIVLGMDASGQPRLLDVETGMVGRKRTEILAGLGEGDTVVTGMEMPDTLPPEWEEK